MKSTVIKQIKNVVEAEICVLCLRQRATDSKDFFDVIKMESEVHTSFGISHFVTVCHIITYKNLFVKSCLIV